MSKDSYDAYLLSKSCFYFSISPFSPGPDGTAVLNTFLAERQKGIRCSLWAAQDFKWPERSPVYFVLPLGHTMGWTGLSNYEWKWIEPSLFSGLQRPRLPQHYPYGQSTPGHTSLGSLLFPRKY